MRLMAYAVGILRREKGVLHTWVLGNITAGGTGKSPHARLFVRELEAILGKGTVGMLSRGYGRDTRGFSWVEGNSTSRNVGDEPLMLKRQMPDVDVAVCEDRLEGLRQMKQQRPLLQWVVLDDAFQHMRLEPDVSTILLDATQPMKRDWLLPAGRLRDLKSSLKRADSALITRSLGDEERELLESGWPGHGPVHATHMFEGPMQPWSEAALEAPSPVSSPNPSARTRILAVAGVARPERFMDGLAQQFQIARREAFPDHHVYDEVDVKRWLAAQDTDAIGALITTEKDAMRLEPHKHLLRRLPVYYIPLMASWTQLEEAKIWIRETVEEIQRGGSLKNQDI